MVCGVEGALEGTRNTYNSTGHGREKNVVRVFPLALLAMANISCWESNILAGDQSGNQPAAFEHRFVS